MDTQEAFEVTMELIRVQDQLAGGFIQNAITELAKKRAQALRVVLKMKASKE